MQRGLIWFHSPNSLMGSSLFAPTSCPLRKDSQKEKVDSIWDEEDYIDVDPGVFLMSGHPIPLVRRLMKPCPLLFNVLIGKLGNPRAVSCSWMSHISRIVLALRLDVTCITSCKMNPTFRITCPPSPALGGTGDGGGSSFSPSSTEADSLCKLPSPLTGNEWLHITGSEGWVRGVSSLLEYWRHSPVHREILIS